MLPKRSTTTAGQRFSVRLESDMRKRSTLLVLLALTLWVAVGCDSGGGGRIQPLSGQGAPSGGAKAGGGPHPMPGGTKAAGS